jgi:hypothetical protein
MKRRDKKKEKKKEEKKEKKRERRGGKKKHLQQEKERKKKKKRKRKNARRLTLFTLKIPLLSSSTALFKKAFPVALGTDWARISHEKQKPTTCGRSRERPVLGAWSLTKLS